MLSRGSPTNYTDPTGHCPICLVVLIAWTLADAHDLFLSGRKHAKADYAFFFIGISPVGRIAKGLGATIGFAQGAAASVFQTTRAVQKAWTHLSKAGLVGNWSAKTSPSDLRSILTKILENPAATADDVLRGTPAKVFLGSVGDAPVLVYISKETGALITAFPSSLDQFMRLFVH